MAHLDRQAESRRARRLSDSRGPGCPGLPDCCPHRVRFPLRWSSPPAASVTSCSPPSSNFPTLAVGVGIDLNNTYVNSYQKLPCELGPYANRVTVFRRSFFDVDWANVVGELPEPILVVGNPPWVTNSDLRRDRKSEPAPENELPKSQRPGCRYREEQLRHFGVDADQAARNAKRPASDTGHALQNRRLRKALLHAWKNDISIRRRRDSPNRRRCDLQCGSRRVPAGVPSIVNCL